MNFCRHTILKQWIHPLKKNQYLAVTFNSYNTNAHTVRPFSRSGKLRVLKPVESPFPCHFSEEMKQAVRMMVSLDDLAYAWDLSWKHDIHEKVNGDLIRMEQEYKTSLSTKQELIIEDSVPANVRVKLMFPLEAIDLDSRGKEIFTELVGPRYNKASGEIKITCDLYPKRKYNLKRCVDILHDLVKTSDEIAKEES